MIKINQEQLIKILIISIIVLIISSFFVLFFKEKSKLLSYSNTNDTIKINIFDGVLKKNQNKININKNDPKNFHLYRNIDENTDVMFTYDKENKKVNISTVQDDISLNGKKIEDDKIIINSIDAGIGDIISFNYSSFIVNENIKNIYKIQDLNNGINIQKGDNYSGENLIKTQNYSFENGPWNKELSICNKINNNKTNFYQSIEKDCTDGEKCLLISSDNNTACANSLFTFDTINNQTYSVSFDYKEIVKDSNASVDIIFMGSDGKNAYYESNLSPEKSFKNFKYNFELKESASGIIIKFKVTGKDNLISSVVFDNLEIKNIGSTKINIDTKNLFKDYAGQNISLIEGDNIFKAIPSNDSEVSSNVFDYFLTFKDSNSNSSFINEIKSREVLSRLSLFLLFISFISFIFSSISLSYKHILKLCDFIFLEIKKIFNIIKENVKFKIDSIKKERKWILIMKILSIILIFGFYLFNTIDLKNKIDLLSSFALFYGLLSILFIIESRISAFIAILYLSSCPILLILKHDSTAELMAVQAFYFLIITVTTQIRENKK